MSNFEALDLNPAATQLARATDGYAGVIVVRYDDEGTVYADSSLPTSAHPIEHMVVALLQEGAARAQTGADSGCPDCGDRADRMRRALAILNEGLDEPAVSVPPFGERMH